MIDGWKSEHHKLLATLRRDYQERVNETVKLVDDELGERLNGWNYQRTKAPAIVVREAEVDLQNLKGHAPQLRTARRDEADVDDMPNWYDWLKLVATLTVCIAAEAGLNTMLLASALQTGGRDAFITAVLVSLINVVGLGAGGGLVLAAVLRNVPSRARRWWGGLGGGMLGLSALALNLVFGRHREYFKRRGDARTRELGLETPSDPVPVPEAATELSLNPLAWLHLESQLFFLMGLGLCAFGIYKGLTFIRTVRRQREEARREKDEASITAKQLREQASAHRFENLPERCKVELEEVLRAKVAGWVEKLDRLRRQARNALEDLKDDWDQGAELREREAEFVLEHNRESPDKIDPKMLEDHRKGIDLSFPATPSDWAPLDKADSVVADWEGRWQREFFDALAKAYNDVVGLWSRYRSVVLRRDPGSDEEGM